MRLRFLIDAQLPPGLAQFLAELGHEAIHVVSVELLTHSDEAIWDYAERNRLILISKDSDFAELSHRSAAGPAVVLVKIGNSTNRELKRRLGPVLPDIEAALAAGERLIEVR